jgi:hypothetical protein
VPGDSPTPALRAVEAGEPNAVVLVPPNGELVDPPPNGFEVVVDPPKVGLDAEPNSPPPVFAPPPKGDDVVPAEEPNPPPPKADVPAVAVPPPNKLPPVVVVAPNAGLAAPKALFVVLLPNAPRFRNVSSCSGWFRMSKS